MDSELSTSTMYRRQWSGLEDIGSRCPRWVALQRQRLKKCGEEDLDAPELEAVVRIV
jgi:hypothetical protein